MANAIPIVKNLGTVSSGASNVKISNVDLTLADTEYSHAFSSILNGIIIRARQHNANLKLSFVSGESGTTYLTLNASAVLSLDNLALSGATLYVQSDKASTIVEITETYS